MFVPAKLVVCMCGVCRCYSYRSGLFSRLLVKCGSAGMNTGKVLEAIMREYGAGTWV